MRTRVWINYYDKSEIVCSQSITLLGNKKTVVEKAKGFAEVARPLFAYSGIEVLSWDKLAERFIVLWCTPDRIPF